MTSVLGGGAYWRGRLPTASPLRDAMRRGGWVRIAYVVRAFVAGVESRTIGRLSPCGIVGSYPATPPHPLHLAPGAPEPVGQRERAAAHRQQEPG